MNVVQYTIKTGTQAGVGRGETAVADDFFAPRRILAPNAIRLASMFLRISGIPTGTVRRE
jgi:hypothetical protein